MGSLVRHDPFGKPVPQLKHPVKAGLMQLVATPNEPIGEGGGSQWSLRIDEHADCDFKGAYRRGSDAWTDKSAACRGAAVLHPVLPFVHI